MFPAISWKRHIVAQSPYAIPVGQGKKRRWVDLEMTHQIVLPSHEGLHGIIGTLALAGADVALIDGTGLRCAAWQGKVWQLGLDTNEVVGVTAAITRERECRARRLREHGTDTKEPLLIVGSFMLLEGVMGAERLRRWLQVETVPGGEVGVRFVVGNGRVGGNQQNCPWMSNSVALGTSP